MLASLTRPPIARTYAGVFYFTLMTTKDFKEVLNRLVGTSNVLSNNVLFIDFCGGSHGKAQFLSQLFYWQSRATRKDGFFFKTYEDWHKEIRLPKHSISRYANSFKESGFLKTKTLKANGFPTVHYQLDTDRLIALLVAFCNDGLEQFATNDSDNLQQSTDSDNLQQSTNIDYHTIQTENTKQTPNGEHPFSKIAGLEQRIGSKQYALLEKLSPENIEALRLMWHDGRAGMLFDWLEYKRTQKPYRTVAGITATVNTLKDYTPNEIREALQTSIRNEYAGLFPKKEQQPKAKKETTIFNLPGQQRRRID